MFLGGTDVAVDGAGAAYVTGGTNNPSFPGVGPGSIQPTFASVGNPPPTDAFVTKVNASGTAFVYSTYLGAADLDGGSGIAVDSSGAAYILGITRSTSGIPGIGPGSLAAELRRRRHRRVRREAEPRRHRARLRLLPRQHRHRGSRAPAARSTSTARAARSSPASPTRSRRSRAELRDDRARERRHARHVRDRAGAERREHRLHRRPRRHRRRQQPRRGRAQPGREPVRDRRDDVVVVHRRRPRLAPADQGRRPGRLRREDRRDDAVDRRSPRLRRRRPPSAAATPSRRRAGARATPSCSASIPRARRASCSLAGSTVHFDHVGTCIVDANQAGNGDYPAAPQAQQTMVVVKGTPVLTWPQPAQIAFGTPLGAAQLDPTASVPGTFAFDPPAAPSSSRARTRCRRRSRPRTRPTT